MTVSVEVGAGAGAVLGAVLVVAALRALMRAIMSVSGRERVRGERSAEEREICHVACCGVQR